MESKKPNWPAAFERGPPHVSPVSQALEPRAGVPPSCHHPPSNFASKHRLSVMLPHSRSPKRRWTHLPARCTFKTPVSKCYLLSPRSCPSVFPDAGASLTLEPNPEFQLRAEQAILALSELVGTGDPQPEAPPRSLPAPGSPQRGRLTRYCQCPPDCHSPISCPPHRPKHASPRFSFTEHTSSKVLAYPSYCSCYGLNPPLPSG